MNEEREVVLETECWSVILMEDQTYLGRSVIVLKRQCRNLSELNQDEIIDFFEIVRQLENLFKKTFGAVMFNWSCLMNDAYKVIPAEPQVHWHVRPRYDKPVEVEDEIFKDPNFGHHYILRSEETKRVSKEVLKMICSKLKENL